MGEKPEQCVKCGGVLVVSETGRPRTFCSPVCRRAAEHELRRVNRALERLENERRELARERRPEQMYQWRDPHNRTLKQARADVSREIEQLESRLRLLLDVSPPHGHDLGTPERSANGHANESKPEEGQILGGG